jgi:hypothetical protein
MKRKSTTEIKEAFTKIILDNEYTESKTDYEYRRWKELLHAECLFLKLWGM